MIIGMDFGTTNSGMAVFDGRSVNVLPLDPGNANSRVVRTALYITNDQSIIIGRGALDRYFDDNIGRPVRLQKVWIGELEVIADMVYYITDVYSWTDVLSPGRLFLSVKSGLRDTNYPGTVISQFHYSLETLIALYLSVTKARAEQLLGTHLNEIVLGRPVHFAPTPEQDVIAEARLLQAAFRAGYEKVYLQYEPVAAAYSYELGLKRPENVLVFDFGGGTLDLTIMRLGEERPRVLATGGVPIAGDVFDQKLVRAKFPRHFGEGSYYGPRGKSLTVPSWIYEAFSDWQRMLELHSAENRKVLSEIAQTAQRRYQIEALLSLASSNYGLKLFDIAETAKRTLSEKRGAEMYLDGPGFSVREFVTRSEFEAIIRAETRAIEIELEETIRRSGLAPGEIDSVIRTGGSALIPVFNQMLARHFGEDKVHAIDTFSSVTSGLGIIAHHLETGQETLRAHTLEDFAGLPEPTGGAMKVKPVNLELLQRRIILAEKPDAAGAKPADRALILLGQPESAAVNAGHADLIALPVSPRDWAGEHIPAFPEDGAWPQPVRQGLVAGLDEQLLLLTSRYRFLLVTARQLIDLREIGLGVDSLHRFAAREGITAMALWPSVRDQDRLLIVTSTGFARAYPLDVLRDSIEAPVSLQFDSPLPGDPVLVQGVSQSEQILLVTESGRGVRWPVNDLPLVGLQALNCASGETTDRVAAALAVPPATEATILLADGYARRLRPEWIETPPRPNKRGRSIIARKSSVASMGAGSPLWALTPRRILQTDVDALPLEDSTRTHVLVKLEVDETVQTVVSGVEQDKPVDRR